jgi:5'-nucleotidase
LHVLLTNDDSINSPGLKALYVAVAAVSGVTVSVIAPDHNWSVSGHNKTMHKPLRVTPLADWHGEVLPDIYTTDGTPADCVSLAGLGFLATPPDLVLSGINTGPNLGDDVTYSGTVAAAMEAHIAGFAAVAISLNAYTDWNFTVPANFAADLVQRFMIKELPFAPNIFLNVNVPNLPPEAIKGVAITKQGRRIYRDILYKREDPFGHPYYWIGGDRPTGEMIEGTDFEAVMQDKISVTPMMLDLTDYKMLKELKGWGF